MPLKGKYLKYSPEITLEIFILIWDKLSKIYQPHINGVNIEYRNFRDNNGFLRIINDKNFGIYYCIKGLIETTVQEILGYDPFIKEGFVLPKKWFVKHNKIIGKWFDNKLSTYCYENSNFNYLYYPAHNDSHIFDTVLEDYTEITFEQFKKYVLKETIETPKEIIPEYVELLEGFDNTCTGKIFNTNQPIPQMSGWGNQWTWESIFKNNIQRSYFKPSTKEAFDVQNQPKPIEKWSVGSYGVVINSTNKRFPIGFIDKIIPATSHKKIKFENYYSYDPGNLEYSSGLEFKWFATKSEAEEFAKTLISSKLENFPNEGFCKTDSIELRNYLKNKFPQYIQKSWNSKYSIIAWNNTGYWWCEEKSSKPEYQLNQLEKFFTKEEVKQPLKQAVHCKTQEEWDFVTEKLGNDGENWFKHAGWGNNKSFCISFEGKNQSQTLDFYQKGNYQILSFQEWCDLNGYKMEKEVKFEVGKWYKSNYFETEYYLKYDKTIREIDYNKIFYSILIKDGEIKENGYIAYTALEKSFNLLTDLLEIQQYLPNNHIDKIKSNQKFKVGDYVFAVGNIKEYKNPTIGQVVEFNDGDDYDSKVDFNCNNNKKCIIWSNIIRHATPEEIQLHAWKSCGNVILSNSSYGIGKTGSIERLDKSLSIFPTFEEKPSIKITEFEEVTKDYFINFKDPYN